MACHQVQEWIEREDSPRIEGLPLHLISHCQTCPDCSVVLAGIKSAVAEFDRLNPSPEHLAELKSISRRKMVTPTPAVDPFFSFRAWLYFSSFALALIGAFILYKWNGSYAVGPLIQRETPVLLIHGRGGFIQCFTGKKQALPAQAMAFSSGDRLELLSQDSSAVVRFPDQGRIDIRGSGTILLRKDGFFSKQGVFNAKFHKTREDFFAVVPAVVLGIRGTEIDFSLNEKEKRVIIELRSGKAEVLPLEKGIGPFFLKVGSKLQFDGGRFSYIEPPEADSASESSTVKVTPGSVRDPGRIPGSPGH